MKRGKAVMKRILSFLLCCGLLLCLLCSCAGNNIQSGKALNGEGLSGTLRGYCYQGTGYANRLKEFEKANPQLELNLTAFQNPSAFAKQVALDAEAGTLPDFILCDTFSDLNLLQLQKQGYLLDLSSYLASEDSFRAEDYFFSAFEGCRQGESLYILPLSLGMPLVYTTQEKQEERGLVIPENYDAPELFLTLSNHIQELSASADEKELACMQLPAEGNPLSLLHGLGLSLWDWKAGQVAELQPEQIQPALEFSLSMYQGMDRAVDLLWGGNWNRALSLTSLLTVAAERATFLLDGGYLYSPEQLQLLLSAYDMRGETLLSYPIPAAGTRLEDQQYGAELISYGAVFAQSQNPVAAYTLLRTLQQQKTGSDISYGVSVNRAAAKAQFGKYQDSPQIEAILSYFDHGVVTLYETTSLYESLAQVLAAYQSGGDFQSFLDQVMNRAEVYLTAPPEDA